MKKSIRNGVMFFVLLASSIFNGYGQESCTFSGGSNRVGECVHNTMQISCNDGTSCSFQWGTCGDALLDEVTVSYFVGDCNDV